MVADESDFGTYDPDKLAALPLLVQTGYLTIKEADGPLGALVYKLGYPNRDLGVHRIEPLDAAQGGTARIRERGEAYAAAAGSVESERLEIARRMKARGIAPAIIAEVTGLSAGF